MSEAHPLPTEIKINETHREQMFELLDTKVQDEQVALIVPIIGAQAIHEAAAESEPNDFAPVSSGKSSSRINASTDDESSINLDLVGQYLKEIGKARLLDAEDEVELSLRIEAGLIAKHKLSQKRLTAQRREELEWLAKDGAAAKQEFLTANLRLVVSVARKYARSSMPLLDLIQEGNTGLIRAVEKFDYTKGYKFSTYATWWIRQSITRGMAQQARIVRLPVHMMEEVNILGRTKRNLEIELGREATPEELATEIGITPKRVIDLTNWSQEHISLDSPVGEDGEATLGDMIARETSPGPDDDVISAEYRDRINSLIDRLNKRDADIIRSRYGLTQGTQQRLAEIGSRHGISAERVRQIERTAMLKLRSWADPSLND